jgi:hypothetical protein
MLSMITKQHTSEHPLDPRLIAAHPHQDESYFSNGEEKML